MYSPRAFECNLQEIKPAFVKSFDDDWNQEANKAFKEAVLGKVVTFEVYSIIDDVVVGKVFTKDEFGNEICWNEKLLAEGYAEECEEVFVSKVNHNERELNRRTFSEKAFGPEKEFQAKRETMRVRPICPPFQKDHIKGSFRLKGPVSPLEVPLSTPVQSVRSYVTIDGSSVNQIVLTENFKDFRPRLCVAAEMYYETDTDKVKLRETTILPNIIGLPILLALIFCPTAQIRCDKDKTRYTSILFGLGADEDKSAHFPDRDSVLQIDFDFSESDIHAINHLRFQMSKLLYVEPHMNMRVPSVTDGMRENLLRKIKELIMKIVSEKRKPRELDEDSTFYWNNEEGEHPLNINKDTRNVYEFLTCPPLIPMSRDTKLKMLQHAKNLEEGGRISQLQDDLTCNLCNVYWSNRDELKIHLQSKLHKTRKAQLENSLNAENYVK